MKDNISVASFMSNVLIFVIILAFLKHQLGIGHPLNDEDIKIKTVRECKALQDCEFYSKLIERTIPGLKKTTITNELKKQNCGWTNLDEEKGKYCYFN